MIESLKVGDTVLAKIGPDHVHQGIVLKVGESFVVDQIQPAALIQFVNTPDDLVGLVRPRPVWSTSTYWTREEDLQAL